MNILRFFIIAIASALCGSVLADSAPMFEMPGSGVMPISNNDVRLVSETIDFYLLDNSYSVEVNYNFYNEGKTQDVELGFPTEMEGVNYYDFETSVNGQSVKVTRKPGTWSFIEKKGEGNSMVSIDQDGKEIPYSGFTESFPHYTVRDSWVKGGNAFDVFNVTFTGGDTTKVKNSYSIGYEGLGHRGGSFFWYILETGRYWKGKIDEVTVRVHTNNYTPSRNYLFPVDQYTNYVRVFKDIEPDFNLYFYRDDNFRTMPEASSTLQAGKNNSYSVENLVDGNPATAWVEGVDGYGEGQTLEFCMACNYDYACGAEQISKIHIVNGYAKNEATFKNNSRVNELEVRVTELVKRGVAEAPNSPYFNLNDAGECDPDVYADRYYYFVLDDTMKEQTLDFEGEKEIFKMKFKIVSVYKGDKYKDTAISEIRFSK